MRKSLLFPLLAVCFAARAFAALPDPYREALEAGARAGFFRDVAAGWIDGKERGTFLIGSATADSRYEIGALTEVFTGTLLAQMAIEGKVRLQTRLRERLPDVAIADPALGGATLESLAVHRVGLPAAPPNLMPANAADPYAGYGEPELRAFLANFRMADAKARYSPLQFGLVGYALARGGIESLLHERILAPLRLKHTDFSDAGVLDGQILRTPAEHWHFGALAGSAGLRSSASDLMEFLQTNLRPTDTPLRAALLLARQPHADRDDVGLGWNIATAGGAEPWPILWRASVTGGFSAFIGFRTDKQQAVVLLNNSDGDLSPIGIALLSGQLPPPAPRAREPTSGSITAADYSGLYQVKGGREMIVRDRGSNLWLQLQGEPAVQLLSVGEDAFTGGVDALTVSFQREVGKVTSLLFSRNGVSVLARRLTERAPRLGRAMLEGSGAVPSDIVGDYQLTPEALLRVSRHGDELAMQITARAAVSLFAFARDRFACEDESCEIAVRRAEDNGNVLGIEVNFAGGETFAERVVWKMP